MSGLPHAGTAAGWRSARPAGLRHLDTAACAPTSAGVRAAVAAYAEREAVEGGYVAYAAVGPDLLAARARLGAVVGLGAADVAWTEGATAGFARLLAAWPLRPGARVGISNADYGSNTMALQARADSAGLELVPLPVDGDGRVTDVPAGLDLVALPHVASQSGVVQPLAAIIAAGAPVIADVAQSAGQVAVPPGAAGYVGTSRKWLHGPRGVGWLAVSPSWVPRLRPPVLSLDTGRWTAGGRAEPVDGVERLQVHEPHVAGQVGLAAALEELAAAGPSRVCERLAALGPALRQRLAAAGWPVTEPLDEPTAIVTLPCADPPSVRAGLLAAGILTSAVPTARAPGAMTGPLLRLSPGPGADEDDLDAAVLALGALGAS